MMVFRDHRQGDETMRGRLLYILYIVCVYVALGLLLRLAH